MSFHKKIKLFFLIYTFPNKTNKKKINVNTGSANGQDWGVIDFPRNPSACWESTAEEEEEEEASLTHTHKHTHQQTLVYQCRLWFISVIINVDTEATQSPNPHGLGGKCV